MMRRLLALILAVVMTVGVLPVNALAAETEETYSEAYTEPAEQTEEEPADAEETEAETLPEEVPEAVTTPAETEEAPEETEEETVPEETEETPEETEEIIVPEETEVETIPEETEEETVPEETEVETTPEETEEITVPEETEEETIPEETEEETLPETESSPIVTTLEELAAVALGEYDNYLLAADLELPADWEPMNLYGSFDANGYTVTLNGQPLFDNISEDSVVSNLILNGSVRTSYAGSLAVTCYGEIRNCVSFARVESTADWADNGGFVHTLEDGSAFNCLFLGTLADDGDTVGYGIAASSPDSDVRSCYWLDAELPMWDGEAEDSRQISWEEAVTAAFLNELNSGLGENDLLWGLNEDGEPVPGGEEPGLEMDFDTFDLEETQPERQLITVMLDETAPYASPFDPDASVVVTVEGHTLGHGFYIEPTVVSFDEFVSYWAGKGVTVAKENITAGGMIDYVLYTNGYSSNGMSSPDVNGRGYLSGIEGIRAGKGDAKVPACLADDGITVEQVDGDDLYQFDYTSGGGWMFTEGNWMSNQAMASHKFSQYGTLHTVNGKNYYVVRLQFTIAGLGADLGFVDWGSSFGYVAADKSDLYIEYATLDADEEARKAALAVMTQLDATQEEVDAATQALWDSVHAEKPEFITNLDEEPVIYACGGEAAPLFVEAVVSEGELSYAWYSSTDLKTWTALPCTDSAYIPSTDLVGTVYYQCIVTNDDGTGMESYAESNIATVICGAQTPVFTTNLSTAEVSYLTIDVAAPLEVKAVVSDGGTISYQWYQSSDKENWFPIPDMDGRSYTPVATEVGTTYYKCSVTNSNGVDFSTAESAIATVTVRVDTPVFDTNLITTTNYIQLEENYKLSVKASVKDGGELSYQWYSGSNSYFDQMSPIDGATEASYTVKETDRPSHTYYKVKVTNTLGGESAEAVSNWSAVNVKVCAPSFESDFSYDDLIYRLNDQKPKSLTVEAVLKDWNLKGELKGTITYQWYVSEERYGTYEPILNATKPSFIPDLTAAGYRYYQCKATNTVQNSNGEFFTATSDSDTATVRVVGSEIPKITTDLPSSREYTLNQADAEPLNVEVTPPSDGGTLSYQWYIQKGDGYCPGIKYMELIEGATLASFPPALTVGGTNSYACRVTNTKDGEATSTDSGVCKVTVNCAYPEITKDLTAETLTYVEGDEAKALTVEAISPDGGTLSYQWYNGSNGIPEATGNSFTIPTNEPGSYSYSVEVTNTKSGAVRSVRSTAVTVKVEAIQQKISTEEALRNMRPNGSYILMNDIELTQKWNPINNFAGILDGNGHTISKVSVPEGAGFFTTTQAGAEIRNLSLNGRISRAGGGDIGGLIGKVEGDTVISGCHIDLAVVGEQTNNAGGIVGNAGGNCLIENSYYTGVLRGQNSGWAYTGGIIGNKTNGVTIKNCYTTNDKLVGSYGWFGVDSSTLVNNYSALGDDYTDKIPEDLTTFHSLLGDAYAQDRTKINRGYPILLWQVVIDKTALNEAIEAALALDASLYTPETWNQVAAALEAAQELAAQNSPSQEAVDAACEVLNEAVANLVLRPVDKSGLESDVAQAKKLEKNLYTEESWASLADALAEAEKILADGDAQQSDVNRAREALKQAVEQLVKRPAIKVQLREAYEKTTGYLKGMVPGTGTIGGEWLVLALARSESGNLTQAYIDTYYTALTTDASILRDIAERGKLRNSTDSSRIITALTAIGKDPRDMLGHNLLNDLNDMKHVKRQGMNGPIWALIALDTRKFPEPDGITRQDLITYILDNQHEDGGWSLLPYDTSVNVDITGMAVYALAPYMDENAAVKAAVEKAVNCLSLLQNANGGFAADGEGENVESCVQVIVALSTLGIDADTDQRFVKNGNSLIDAFLTCYTESGAFKHTADGAVDQMSTEQALYAMAAYFRNREGKNTLFDMSDVKLDDGDNTETVDKTALKSAIEKAEGLKESDYTKKSWAVLKTKLASAKMVLNNSHAAQAQVNAAAKALNDAIDQLVKETVDKAALEDAIEKAENLKESDYTKKSWASLKAKLASAKTVLSNSNATQAQVDAAAKALNDAMDQLVKETVDKSALEDAIEKAESLKESDYTKKSWAAAEASLKEKLANAKNVSASSSATQAQVDAAAKALNDIVGKLVKNTAGSSNGGSSGSKVSTSGSKVNRTKLDAEVKKAQKLQKEDYTEESWKVFETALVNAQNALKSAKATQKQLDDAYGKLVAAEKALKRAGTVGESRSKLEAEVKESEKLAEQDYTDKSWKTFASALDKARKVLKDEEATVKQLEDACTKLAAARKALKPSSGDSRTKLESLVEKSGELVESNYTAESWASFAEALDKAKAVLENKDAAAKELDDARAALNEAGRALIPVESAEEAGNGGSALSWLIALVILQTAIIGALVGWFLWKRKRI